MPAGSVSFDLPVGLRYVRSNRMSEHKDIRSGIDYEDTGYTIRSDQDWLRNVPTDDLQPQIVGVRPTIPLQTDKGVNLVDQHGRAMGIKSEITHTHDKLVQAWKRKQLMEPCWMCKHFRRGLFTPQQKHNFLRDLFIEHGMTQEMIDGEVGNIDVYEYCPVYKLLTHPKASCPRYWVRRDDL